MDHFQRSGESGRSSGSYSPPSIASFYLPPHLNYASRSSHAPSKVTRPSHSLEEDMGNLGAINSFTRKLYHMVTTEDPDIISFTPDGLAFHVKDPKRLELEVLPRYFRHSRFQSLVRQLNFYNFRKASKERVLWVYRHKLFRRDRPDLLECLRRKPSANLAKSRLNRSNNLNHPLCSPSGNDRFTSLSTRGDVSPPPPAAPRPSGRSQRLQPFLILDEVKHDQSFSPTFASGRTSTTSSTSSHSPSSGRTSEASTPESEGFPLSPAGLCLFSRKRQRLEGEDSLDHHRSERELEDEVETLEAFMELSRVRTGPSPTESAATSRDDDMDDEEEEEEAVGEEQEQEEEGDEGENEEELEKQDMGSYYLGALRDHHNHDADLTSGDDHSDAEDVMVIASPRAKSPPSHASIPVHRPLLSPLSDFTSTTADQDEWSSIQALSYAAWGSTEGLVSSLSEQLPSYTHCQFIVFCLETAPYVPSPTLCEAIHTVLTTCQDVAESLLEMMDMLHLDSQILRVDFQSLVEEGMGLDRSMLNDRLVRVFLFLALNYLHESMGCLQGLEAEVLQRCHQFWTRHAARFF